jgi:hypothetical protein
MQRILACLAALLLSACAVGNQHDYTSAAPQLTVQGSGSAVVAVQDQRPYILDHDKTPNFCGLFRGGFGNPFDVTTQSNNPLAADFRSTIVAALKNKGLTAEPVETTLALSDADARQSLLAAAKDHALLLVIKEWKSDTYFNTGLLYDLTLTVFDRTGAVAAQSKIAAKDNLGPAALPRDARIAVAKAYQAKLETLLNDPNVVEALQQ